MQCGAPILRRKEGVDADMLREGGACCPPPPPPHPTREECLAASSSLGTAPGTEALSSLSLAALCSPAPDLAANAHGALPHVEATPMPRKKITISRLQKKVTGQGL